MTSALSTCVSLNLSKVKHFAHCPLAIATLSLSLLWSVLPFGVAAAATPEPASSLRDGTYLYGESPDADQIGTTYMVVEVDNGDVVGGFYQPRSSFDCFHGEIAGDAIALTVINSYEQTEYPFSIALETRSQVASQGHALTETVPADLYRLSTVNETAQSVLNTCQSNL